MQLQMNAHKSERNKRTLSKTSRPSMNRLKNMFKQGETMTALLGMLVMLVAPRQMPQKILHHHILKRF